MASISSLALICSPVKSKTDACDVYNIHECKQISPGCRGSVSNKVGSTAAARSQVGVVFVSPGDHTAILEGNLLVK